MKIIDLNVVKEKVKQMCIEANIYASKEVEDSIKEWLDKEDSSLGQYVLKQILDSYKISGDESMPVCQDTGTSVFMVTIGQDVRFTGGDLKTVINEAVASGYKDGYLRGSIVSDPLVSRRNTGDNTPPVIHIDVVKDEELKIAFMAKGSGCENMGRLKMLKPSDGVEGVRQFVYETVQKAGGMPCPPVVIGVGIGSNFEGCAILAKKALFRNIGELHNDPFYRNLEKELLDGVNRLGIGPGGWGGRFTAIAVHIETAPCHIASLPVAVNIDCHAHRVREVIF
ncbi:MAG: fumarate hydratase [Deltaproteobacteria bacterium GWC2_42_11]|nr:MAG: fumarate hydratase [Deltaproteobacteria bacterium GWC2_42_11]HBO83736.1 fumarate hydratase [Deltaproteobacteria bacterium]